MGYRRMHVAFDGNLFAGTVQGGESFARREGLLVGED